MSSEAVAERMRRAQERWNSIGWCLAATAGIGLAYGATKMAADLRKARRPSGKRKEPWEID